MAIEMLYFSWVREGIGAGSEQVEPPHDVTTVAQLLDWLAGRSAAHAQTLADRGRLRAAVDQHFVTPDTSIAGAREIAIFPPVTGG